MLQEHAPCMKTTNYPELSLVQPKEFSPALASAFGGEESFAVAFEDLSPCESAVPIPIDEFVGEDMVSAQLKVHYSGMSSATSDDTLVVAEDLMLKVCPAHGTKTLDEFSRLSIGLQSVREDPLDRLKNVGRKCLQMWTSVHLGLLEEDLISLKKSFKWNCNDVLSKYCNILWALEERMYGFDEMYKESLLTDFYEYGQTWCQGSANLVMCTLVGMEEFNTTRDYMNSRVREFESNPQKFCMGNLADDLDQFRTTLLEPAELPLAVYCEIDCWNMKKKKEALRARTGVGKPKGPVRHAKNGGHVFVIQATSLSNGGLVDIDEIRYSVFSSWHDTYSMVDWMKQGCHQEMNYAEMQNWVQDFEVLLYAHTWTPVQHAMLISLFGIEEKDMISDDDCSSASTSKPSTCTEDEANHLDKVEDFRYKQVGESWNVSHRKGDAILWEFHYYPVQYSKLKQTDNVRRINEVHHLSLPPSVTQVGAVFALACTKWNTTVLTQRVCDLHFLSS